MEGPNGQTPSGEVIDFEKAKFQIGLVRTNLGSFGGNDSEIPELDRLLESLKKGEVTPEEAYRRANEIQNSKMGMGRDDMYR